MNAGESFNRIEDLRAWLEKASNVQEEMKPTEPKGKAADAPTQATDNITVDLPSSATTPSSVSLPYTFPMGKRLYMRPGYSPEEKDHARIEGLYRKRDGYTALNAARLMATKIKDKTKAWRRMAAAEVAYNKKHDRRMLTIAAIFYDRFLELGGSVI